MSDEKRILDALSDDGTFRTNREIREQLKFAEARYWTARDRLVAEGKLIKSRGNGGRVAKNIKINSSPSIPADASASNRVVETEAEQIIEEIREENKLYFPFSKSIERRARDEGAENTIVEITARQGSKPTGGAWSRPDVCQVSVTKLRYLGQKVVEVTTFELKTSDCDVSAVFEALSHSRRAHRSYLAIYYPSETAEIRERLERIKVECTRSGVGLIRFTDPADPATFVTVVEPKANWVDLSEVDEFISTQITAKEKIRDWL